MLNIKQLFYFFILFNLKLCGAAAPLSGSKKQEVPKKQKIAVSQTKFEDIPKVLQDIISQYAKEWNIPEKVKELKGYANIIAASPDNQYLALSNNAILSIIDTNTWEDLTPDLNLTATEEVKFSPDSQLVAVSHFSKNNGSVKIFSLKDIKNQKPLKIIEGGNQLVAKSLSFSPDSKKLAIGFNKLSYRFFGHDRIGLLKIINLENGTEVSEKFEYPQVAFLPDGKLLYCFTAVNPQDNRPSTFFGFWQNPENVISVPHLKMMVSPNGKYVAFEIQKQIYIFDIINASQNFRLNSQIKIKAAMKPDNFIGVHSLQFITDKYLAAIIVEEERTEDYSDPLVESSIYIWDVTMPQKEPIIITRKDLSLDTSKERSIRTFAISPDEEYIVVSDVHNLKIFNFQDLLKEKHD